MLGVAPEGGCGSPAGRSGTARGWFIRDDPRCPSRAPRSPRGVRIRWGSGTPEQSAICGCVPAFQEREDGHARFGLSPKRAPLQELAASRSPSNRCRPASCAAGGGECLAAPHRASATDPAPRAADFARSRNGIRGGTDYRTSNSISYAERQLSSRSVSPGTGSTQSPSW